MKKKTRLLSGIIAGLAFMFVFGVNLNVKRSNNSGSLMSLLSLKHQEAQAESSGGNTNNCIFDLSDGVCCIPVNMDPECGCCW